VLTSSRSLKYLGLSLLAHLQVILVVGVIILLNPDVCDHTVESASQPVEVELLDPPKELQPPPVIDPHLKHVEKMRIKKSPRSEATLVEKKVMPPDPPQPVEHIKLAQQVVDIAPPTEEKAPESTRFLSEYDTAVEKEQKSRTTGIKARKEASTPKQSVSQRQKKALTAPPAKQRPSRRKIDRRAEDRRVANRQMTKTSETARQHASTRQETQPSDSGEDPPVVRHANTASPEKTANKSQAKVVGDNEKASTGAQTGQSSNATGSSLSSEDLRLTDREALEVVGDSSADYIEDVGEGDKTLLNSKRWIYASFFNRVKQEVAARWDPATVYKAHDPAGHHYGRRNRITVLRLTVNAQGRLVGMQVTKASGMPFLDNEARRAFREAAPFRNTPKALIFNLNQPPRLFRLQ